MANSMDFWNQPYYSCLKILSRSLGLWPYQSPRESFICRSIAIFLFFFQTIPQTIALRNYYNDFQLVMESMTYFMIDLTVILNFITYFSKTEKMRKLLNRIREDWELFTKDNGLNILHKYASQGRKFTLFYAGSLYLCSMFVTLIPLELRLINILLKTNISVPKFFIPMEYPMVNVDRYYYCIFCLTQMSVSIIMLMIVTYDIFFFLCAQHICGLFAALGAAIERVPTAPHLDKRTHVKLLDEILHWNTFILLGLTMVDMSMIELQLVLHLKDISRVLKNFIFIGSVMMRFFIVCFVSQRVTNHSVDFQKNIMNSQWCDTSRRSQNLIKFVMMRSQIPCQLTAGKVLVMSFELFTVIMKTSGSYFTMLLAMQ
ncbi:odorant receptor 82a-like [Diachasmimorpha longicaudata]|uniref:odorant receptor 82a-like n=1 Tax=Diachasmimorpha longicaudata TaxID=58733 RepID=UPI0030B8C997